MVSFQLESGAEVSPRFTCGIKAVAIWISRILQLVSLLFGNHFVDKLTWPRQERRMRLMAMVELIIFNLLSTNIISEPDAEASPQFLWGIFVVAIAGLLRFLAVTKPIELGAEASPQFLC